jgi:C-terminal processing protease CtpA/Prc
MNNNFILVPALLVLGVAAGVAMMYQRDQNIQQPGNEPHTSPSPQVEISEHPMANAFVISQVSDSERIQALENQIQLLSERIEQLEQSADVKQEQNEETAALVIHDTSAVDTPVSSLNPAVTTQSLVKAGIDAELAADIVRRRNEIDMKILQLRDRASREAYLNTARYSRELQELRDQDISLRDEIGDDYYDSYLFANRQSNRVKVASVMMGSPAEESGMMDGDLILSYDNRKIFNWNELQDATSGGQRDEYVNVTVLRNGQLVNLWMPRGPLGIRLGSARIRPE